jgi:restriction system protein
MTAWRDYQEQTAQFFRDLGLAAETDVTVQGVRTSHDVDVLVRFDHVGFEVTWIVECKLWQTPVTRLHVLALRTIVSETGADRGILMAERGFQSGAVEAADLTNVQLTSLAGLGQTSGHAIGMAQLRALQEQSLLGPTEPQRNPTFKRVVPRGYAGGVLLPARPLTVS